MEFQGPMNIGIDDDCQIIRSIRTKELYDALRKSKNGKVAGKK